MAPITTRSIDENTPVGTDIGAVTATDPDSDDDLIYNLGTGNDEGSFGIVETSGQLRINVAPDYEDDDLAGADHSYTLTVTVTDGKNDDGDDEGNTPAVDDTITVIIEVTDVNEVPIFVADNIGDATFSIPENADPDTAVTPSVNGLTFAAMDDEGGTVSYSLDSSSDEFFDIDEDGMLTSAVTLDHETQEAYTVEITATDDGTTADGKTTPESTTITVIIGVTDVNEVPVFDSDIGDATFSIAENTVGTVDIGAPIAVTDPEGGTIGYSITANTQGFDVDEIEGTGVQLQLITSETTTPLDHETQEAYTVEITATDDGTPEESSTITVTITVTDVNEAPGFLQPLCSQW